MRHIFIFFVLTFFLSCSKLDGIIKLRKKSNDNNVSYVFLVNSSTSKKYQFTIQKIIRDENGKSYSNGFYTLEPGQEELIGANIAYMGDTFFKKIVYDTLETTLTETNIKMTGEELEKEKILANMIGTKLNSNKVILDYKLNNTILTEFQVSKFLKVYGESKWKHIDSLKKGNKSIDTYLIPKVVDDISKPKEQNKITFTYVVKGQKEVE